MGVTGLKVIWFPVQRKPCGSTPSGLSLTSEVIPERKPAAPLRECSDKLKNNNTTTKKGVTSHTVAMVMKTKTYFAVCSVYTDPSPREEHD